MQPTPRQLFIGLATAGFITEAEAVAAAGTGAMPTAVEAAIAPLPAEAQLAARITWARMTLVNRTDPLVALLAGSQGLGEAELDARSSRASRRSAPPYRRRLRPDCPAVRVRFAPLPPILSNSGTATGAGGTSA